MLVCRACTPNRYTLQSTCPECGGPTVEAYGSASKYQAGSGRSLKQLVRAYPPQDEWPPEKALEDVAPQRHLVPSSYGLIHTLGRTKYDELGGDGAYSRWMQRHFSGTGRSSAGCIKVDQIIHDGPFGTISNRDLAREFNPVFLEKFKALLQSGDYAATGVIILNWHIRFTNGTPNGWTGRGINADLVEGLRALCKRANKTLGIVYTIHEASQLQQQLCSPVGLIPLNPAVHASLGAQFPATTTFQSRVPGLLTSTHTTKIDLIMKLVGAYLSPIDVESPSSNTYFAHGQQVLRLDNGATHGSLGLQGIVIFGMIMPRHGLTVTNVTLLSDLMDAANLHAHLRIVIAGKESNAELVAAFKSLARRKPRVHFLGELADFVQLAGCRYAISFDELGYRDNASAMVNVIREGHLLFSRRNRESDDLLVRSAVRTMAICEKSSYMYYELLAKQQPRMRNTSPGTVGANLDGFFQRIAATLSSQ